MKLVLAITAAVIGASAHAAVLNMPANAVRQMAISAEGESTIVPLAPWANGTLPSTLAEGTLSRNAWKILSSTRTTQQILAPLRAQLIEAGFEVVFECSDVACGGFDFRFGIDILPEPEMHIDLGDFKYLTARKQDEGGQEYLMLMVSRSPQAGYVQVTRIGQGVVAELPVVASTRTSEPETNVPPVSIGAIGDLLAAQGHAPLEDLVFGSGSSDLTEGEYPSMVALADWLRTNPDHTITLVGHTDNEGTLAGNIALSKRRAASVRSRLISKFDVPAEQIAADGVGFLSPRASNLSDEGREQNRRVEVILTPTR